MISRLAQHPSIPETRALSWSFTRNCSSRGMELPSRFSRSDNAAASPSIPVNRALESYPEGQWVADEVGQCLHQEYYRLPTVSG